VPVVSLSRPLADRLLRAAGWESVDSTQERIDRTAQPSSVLLRHTVNLETRLTPSTVKSSNVVGVLDGKGPLAEQTVIVGAHYDHVGMGGFGSLAPGTIAVHNGADDNASGTAAMLSSVGRIQAHLADTASHRRIVFIAFTGEERGLLGSEYYVRHPPFPLESTVAMINLDMVGRLRDNDLTVYGTGTALEMDAIVDAANESTGFKLFKVPSGYGPSDHQSFYTQKIPVVFFFTGLHNDYHRPSDDFDKINFNGLTRITDITSGVAVDLATRLERPRYAATGRDASIRWQATAHLGVQLREAQDGRVMITGVTPGGAAEAAGILVGDKLEKFDDVEIRTIAEVLETIRSREAGDPLSVELRRGDRVMTLVAILQKQPG
jgi:Zn-dependent M28 family amino/carboxypeptidase